MRTTATGMMRTTARFESFIEQPSRTRTAIDCISSVHDVFSDRSLMNGRTVNCLLFIVNFAKGWTIVVRMNRVLATLLILLITAPALAQSDAVAVRIDRILRDVPLIDGHNDLPDQYEERAKHHLAQIDLRQDQSKLSPPLQTDIPRLRQGRLGAQFWSVYVPGTLKGADAVRAVLGQIDVVHRIDATYPETFEFARTADD